MNTQAAIEQVGEDGAVAVTDAHTASADPSGNALGLFTIGQVIKLRTRVTNNNGTTTSSIRTLKILNPAP